MNEHKDKMINFADETAKKHKTRYNVFIFNNNYEMVLDSYFISNPDQKSQIVFTTKDYSDVKNQ